MSDLREALDVALTADGNPHSTFSMSGLGVCQRQAAYWTRQPDLAEPQPSHPTALLGTAIHDHLLHHLAAALGGQQEVPCVWEPEGLLPVRGTADLVLDDEVVDIKTVNMPVRQPRTTTLFQVTGYALALGKSRCTVVYLQRATGEYALWSWDTSEYAEAVRVWWDDACSWGDPHDVPRPLRGPGIDKACDWCPFVEDCWPFPASPYVDPQAVLVAEGGDDVVIGAARAYDDTRAQIKSLTEDLDFYRAVLSGTEGRFGDLSLHWKPPRVDLVLDGDAARKMLDEAGLPVPMKEKRVRPSIDLRRVADG